MAALDGHDIDLFQMGAASCRMAEADRPTTAAVGLSAAVGLVAAEDLLAMDPLMVTTLLATVDLRQNPQWM